MFISPQRRKEHTKSHESRVLSHASKQNPSHNPKLISHKDTETTKVKKVYFVVFPKSKILNMNHRGHREK